LTKNKKCVVCSRESDGGDFCRWHKLSYEKLKETFKRWKDSTEIGWKEFLEEILKNPNTGIWVREVATYILKKEG